MIPVPELAGITTRILSEDREEVYQDGEPLGCIVRETIDWSAFGKPPTHEWRPEGTKGKRMAGDRLHAIRRLPNYAFSCTAEAMAVRLTGLILGSYNGGEGDYGAYADGTTVVYTMSKRARFRITVEKLP